MRDPVNLHIPQHFHAFSTCGFCSELSARGALKLRTARNDIAFRFELAKMPMNWRTPKQKTEN